MPELDALYRDAMRLRELIEQLLAKSGKTVTCPETQPTYKSR